MSQIHRPIWLFQAQTLTSNPSQLLAPAVFTIWSEDFSQPRQVLWAGIINLIQFQTFPHPTHSSKLKPSLLIPNSIFFNAVSPWHPIQFQPCWSTFPELSFKIYKVAGISIIKFWIATKCSTCINVIYTFRHPNFRPPSWYWLLRVKAICPSWNIFRIDFLYIRGESSLIKFIYVWPAFRLQYRSEKCHIFRHSQSFGTRALFSLKIFSIDPTFAELKDTKQNQQLWSRDKVLEKNSFGFTVAGELNGICEGGVSSSVCGGGLLEICNEAASFDLTWSPSPILASLTSSRRRFVIISTIPMTQRLLSWFD